MILKSQHLYKAASIVGSTTYKVWDRKNVLISPKNDFNTDSVSKMNIDSLVVIDISNQFNEDVEMFLTKDSFIFEDISVGDIFEIAHVMNVNNSKYRYNFKTNKIELKSYESNR